MAFLKSKRGLLLLSALAIYFLISLLYFGEALFTDRVQICSDTILRTYPWALERPDDFTPRNLAISDQCTVFYPYFHYIQKMLCKGDLPLWSPHVMGGAPYMGNLSTAMFFPLNWLLLIVSLNAFFLLQCIIKVVFTGLFTYLFLRKLKFAYGLALFGGACYAFSGFSILWVISNLTSVAMLMPALFWATEVFLERKNGPALMLISLLLSLQFLAAQPETSLCITAAWGIYTLFRIRGDSGFFSKACGIRLLYLFIGGLLSGCLVLFQMWPFLEYMNLPCYGLLLRKKAVSSMEELGGNDPLFILTGLLAGLLFLGLIVFAIWIFKRGRTKASSFLFGLFAGVSLMGAVKTGLLVGLNPHFLIQLFPDMYGNPLDGVIKGGGADYPEFNGGYVGILPLMLAVIGIAAYWSKKPVGVLSALLILSYGAVHSVPFVGQFVKSIPLIDICQPGRIISVTTFCAAVLSVFGLKYIIDRVGNNLSTFSFAGILIAAAAISIIGGWGFFESDCLTGGAVESESGVLTTPRPGDVWRSESGVKIKGNVAPELQDLSFHLGGLGLGRPVSMDEAGNFEFEDNNVLMRFKEGTYCMNVQAKVNTPGADDKPVTIAEIPINLVHPKQIATKDLFVLIGAVLVLFLLFIKAIPKQVRISIAMCAAIGDLAIFGVPYNVTTEPEMVFPDNSVTDYLTANRCQSCLFRILPENATLQPCTNYFYEYSLLRGYDAMEIPEYNKVVTMMKKDKWATIDNYNSRTMDYESPVMDLLGVKYIISEDDLDHIKGLNRVLDGKVKIYENFEYMQKAFVVGNALKMDYQKLGKMISEGELSKVGDYLAPALKEGTLERITESDLVEFLDYIINNFNFREWAVLEEEIPGFTGGGDGEVEIEKYENEYISLNVKMRGEGLCILTDSFYPGWKVKVDGEDQKIYRSLAFRAVPVTDGEHKVEFVYQPDTFSYGIKVSLAGLFIMLLFMFVPKLSVLLKQD